MSDAKNTVYAAAQSREFLRNELKGKTNEYIREFAGLIDDPATLELLNHRCSLYEDSEEDYLDTREAEIIISSASTHMMDGAIRSGNVSQMQGAVGLTNNNGEGDAALCRMARSLTFEGYIALVLGPPGAGKTATTLDVARIWKALTGGTIISNIKSWTGADRTVTTDREAMEAMASIQGPVLLVIDEGSQSLTSRGAEAEKSNRFAKTLKYVRKEEDGDSYAKQGSVVVIGHTRKDTAADIRRLASEAWEKPDRTSPGKVVIYDSDGGKDGLEQVAEFTGITDTAETYDEHEASSFIIEDIDDPADDGDDLTREDIEREPQIKTAIRAVKPWDDSDGMSQADAAQLVDYSDSWVGDRCREWLAGDHRDLVAAPDALANGQGETDRP